MDEFVNKLIDRLKEHHNEVRDMYLKGQGNFALLDGKMRGIEDANAIIVHLAKEHNGGWIPCSERLPGEYEYALVWCKGYFASGTHIGEECQWYGIGLLYNKNKWEVYQCKDIKDIEVLGWQPLPEPYKECEKQ